MIKNEKSATIMKSLQQIINTYQGRGLNIKHILGDGQFKYIRKVMETQRIMVIDTGWDEHVPEVERYIRTI